MFTKDLEATLERAVLDARRRRHEMVCMEHVLLALLDDAAAADILAACGADLEALRQDLETYLAALPAVPVGKKIPFEQSIAVTRALQRAAMHVESAGKREIDAGDLIASMLKEKDSQATKILSAHGIRRLDVVSYLSHGITKADAAMPAPGPDDEDDDDSPAPGARTTDPLAAFTTELVARARAGKIDPLIGRAAEIERMTHVLARRRKNNPILVGEAGVGKTAIAEGLALAIAEGKVPAILKDAEIFALEMGTVVAGTKFRGEFEKRLKAIVEALRQRPKAILMIDEIHTIVGAGAVSGGTLDASNILKPALGSGELRVIGSTTHHDYQNIFERDRALARRFQKIDVAEPTVTDTIAILRGLAPRYEQHHGVKYTDDAVVAAAELGAKHLTDRHLPDKAIDVLDEAGAAVHLGSIGTDGQVTPAEIEAVVAKMARVPVRSVSRSDRDRLRHLERDLKLVIYGQDRAVESLVAAIKLARSGLGNPQRPTGCFLFSGPTGVGKTELARQLARTLGVELHRFDMSEYMEKHSVSRLIGAPPGYVGFDQPGQLTDCVRKNPYAVLVLDEIEKAHPDLTNILLQVMDHATLTDHNGRKADFRNVVLVMTTNAGAQEAAQASVGFGSATRTNEETKAIERLFAPEFRNRLDAWISFQPLGRDVVLQIVDKFLAALEEQLRAKNVHLDLSDAARGWLADRGFDRLQGARPMERLIDREVRRKLADELLFGALENGGKARVDVEGGELVVRAEAEAAKAETVG